MSLELMRNRNRLIAGMVIIAVLVLLILFFLVRFLLPRDSERLRIGHRFMLTTLSYCAAEQDKLCVVAFSQDLDGGMQITLQTPRPTYPLFDLSIQKDDQVSLYECVRMKELPTSVVCTGPSQVPGEVLEFTVLSRISGTMLAEGRFAIIGVALVTPVVEETATIEVGTETPTETSTDIPLFRTPTPTSTPLVPSYPNPTTYPNPSYP